MWSVYCADCGYDVLVDYSQLRRVTNLASGVIAVELRCPASHEVRVLTGRAAHSAADRTGPREL